MVCPVSKGHPPPQKKKKKKKQEMAVVQPHAYCVRIHAILVYGLMQGYVLSN